MSKKLGGSGSGKGAPSDNDRLPQPQNGPYSGKAVRSQQLHPGRIPSHSATDDYAGDGKSYGVGGNKQLPSNKKSPDHHGM